jgi:hypothetical protein
MRVKRLLRRIKGMDIRRAVRKALDRRREWVALRRTSHPIDEKRPVFILGCNRSGTNMACDAVGRSPHAWAYPESEFSLAFTDYYLRAGWIIERLIRHTPAPIVAFGSILDSQFADELLTRFPGARAIWVYRRYEDMANSCVRRPWGNHFQNFARWVARGELDRLGARGKRITKATVKLFGELYRDDLSPEDYACLYWYLRNQVYFDLELHKDSRVLIMQYEDAVLDPEKALRRTFDFLGFPYDPVIIDGIFSSSVDRHRWPGINPGIREVCEALKDRLDSVYAGTSNATINNG